FLWKKTKIKACHPEPRQPPALGTAARRLMAGREDPLDYNQWRPKRSRQKVFLGARPKACHPEPCQPLAKAFFMALYGRA
ncbi:MAG TPA: hypothetical protein VMZ06_03310, partial [Candidatus Bathyarchaeia archaeon]|nr:hypothetical protein [Candidatus Bathyarchaeia archaeon]